MEKTRCSPRCSPRRITEAAVAAGVDVSCGSTYGEQLPLALRLGLITPAMVDRAVARGLHGWLELGCQPDWVLAYLKPSVAKEVLLELFTTSCTSCEPSLSLLDMYKHYGGNLTTRC